MADAPPPPEEPAVPIPAAPRDLPVAPGAVPGPRPPARSNVASTAQRLIAEYTLTRHENNTEPTIRYIQINANMLFSTYSNTIKPIVYGNFRNVGARTVTDAADTAFLDNVVRTVATNAVVASYAVAYTKAAVIDASSSTRFGDYDPVDCLRFPTLTSHLINALGPVEAVQLPYKCTFIPVIRRRHVEVLLAQNGYTSHYYESFLQAMKRGRTIAMSDVDVNTRDSTQWWTLYFENVRPSQDSPGHITAFSPFSFDDRNSTTLIASLVCEDTLYALPGPIIVHTIGPFVATREPQDLDDIPPPFNERVYWNRHVPAIAYRFLPADTTLTEAGLVHYGHLQGDQDILNLTNLFYDLGSDEEEDPSEKKVTRGKKKKSGKKNEGSTTDSLDEVSDNVAFLYVCRIMYFDCKIADQVPHYRRSTVVTSSNALE